MNPYSTSLPHTQSLVSRPVALLPPTQSLFYPPTRQPGSASTFHTASHTFAGPGRFTPPVSVPMRSVSPYFLLDMPPPRLFIRFCTVSVVPLSSTTGPSFPCFSRENGPALFAITYLIPYLGGCVARLGRVDCAVAADPGRRVGPGVAKGVRIVPLFFASP